MSYVKHYLRPLDDDDTINNTIVIIVHYFKMSIFEATDSWRFFFNLPRQNEIKTNNQFSIEITRKFTLQHSVRFCPSDQIRPPTH